MQMQVTIVVYDKSLGDPIDFYALRRDQDGTWILVADLDPHDPMVERKIEETLAMELLREIKHRVHGLYVPESIEPGGRWSPWEKE